jgi:hypothetical protein
MNDLCWLATPLKLEDPGVVLTLAGKRREGKQVWDKLSLGFENVGLTPGDHHWL